MPQSFETREDWLQAAASVLRVYMPERHAPEPPDVYLSVGWPRGARGSKKTLGQHWNGAVSADGRAHIFVSPILDQAVPVLAVLLHELLHAALPTGTGHGPEFARNAKAIGFGRPYTELVPTDDLRERCEKIARELGPYPHAALTDLGTKKQPTRMRLYECPACHQKIRAATNVLAALCIPCSAPFERKDK